MERDVNKEYIAYLTETDFVCGRCNGQALVGENCEGCDLLMPFEAPLKIYNSGPMCILRDVPALDSISSIVR